MFLKTTLLGATLLASAAQASPIDDFVARPRVNPANAAEVKAACDEYLAKAASLQTILEHDAKPGTINTMRAYDAMFLVLDAGFNDAVLVAEVAVDDPRRDAARACQARFGDAYTAIGLSPTIYRRLKSVKATDLDDGGRNVLVRALANYERAGAAADDATRARITALQSKITADSILFDANIANGRKTFTATSLELTGLPADFLAAHKPGADGLVTLSTDYPDVSAVMSYAASSALRTRMTLAFLTGASPANDPVLTRLLGGRDALAHELGRADFATLALEDKMVNTPAKARAFLEQVASAAEPAARRDYATILARLKLIDPAATTVSQANSSYVQQLICKESYSVNAQEVRRYFAFDNVQKGIFQLTQDLFGVTVRPWQTPVWDKSVEAFEMVDDGKVIGRFYLDMHPRPGKYSHANEVSIRNGIAGRAIPVAALVTNFPAGDHSTGLMEHRDVETFLHEYGHLLHSLFSGNVGWEQANMGNQELDFIEAPSQMLENWVWDYDTLKRFAVDKDGKTIPKDLVERMNRARYFGEALGDRRQLGAANVSLSYHSGPPPADLTAAFAEASDRYALVPTLAGTHAQDSFGHLTVYSAFYYTYTWSKLISTDLFTAFASNGLRDPATAKRYRELVLAPGGSKPAATLVADFLGRPFSMDAYRSRLNHGN